MVGSGLLVICSRGRKLHIRPAFYVWRATLWRKCWSRREGYALAKTFKLTLGGLHEKHAVQFGWIVSINGTFAVGAKKPRKTEIQLVGCRTFRIRTDFQPASIFHIN